MAPPSSTSPLSASPSPPGGFSNVGRSPSLSSVPESTAGTRILDTADEKFEQLNEASRRGDVATVQSMLKQGFTPNVRVKPYLWTPLHMAAREGKLDVMKLLVEHGADVNVVDNIGQTALHRSLQHGHRACAEFLMAKRADPTIVDTFRQTAVDIAANTKESYELHAQLVKLSLQTEKKRAEQAKKEKKKQEERERKLAEQQRKLLKLEEKKLKDRRGSNPENRADAWIAYINSSDDDGDNESGSASSAGSSTSSSYGSLTDSHGRRWSLT